MHLQSVLNKILNCLGSRLGLVDDPVAAVPLLSPAQRQPGCTKDAIPLWELHALPPCWN